MLRSIFDAGSRGNMGLLDHPLLDRVLDKCRFEGTPPTLQVDRVSNSHEFAFEVLDMVDNNSYEMLSTLSKTYRVAPCHAGG